jgi:hypothetical protein
MSNYTFTIKDCAIPAKPFKNQGSTFLAGKLHWQEGTIDFEKNFRCLNSNFIALIDANFGAETRFEVTGSLTKTPGKKGTQWETKMFEEIIIEEIKTTTEARKFNAKELVEEALKAHEETEEEIPF